MKFEIIATPRFSKDLKHLSKKYPSIKSDYAKLLDSLEYDPKQGIALGQNCFKIRISIQSKNKASHLVQELLLVVELLNK